MKKQNHQDQQAHTIQYLYSDQVICLEIVEFVGRPWDLNDKRQLKVKKTTFDQPEQMNESIQAFFQNAQPIYFMEISSLFSPCNRYKFEEQLGTDWLYSNCCFKTFRRKMHICRGLFRL